ncbi:N-acetylmuramoyl-L-alanine amidase [Chakrabartyella piscis]|uniref:N-acetylmuramoyl-L-alanine amidase n=1 Tax=Chakrabartyella piscis TaxID=2918914 RepID=UPI002958C205|nr:N-acetylmuramoyl-L-alanine amidase [Chakrabartyella piscis]
MKGILKRLSVALLAMSMMVPQVVLAKEVQMNLYYNGANHSYDADAIHIVIDDEELETEDMPAVSIDGRTMLPMRVIAEALGCEVLWVAETSQAFIMSDDYAIAFSADADVAMKNGVAFDLDVPAMNINDRMMLPVRALADALDLDLTWVDATRTVAITTSGYEAPTVTTPSTSTSTGVKTTSVVTPSSTKDAQIFTVVSSGAVTHYEEYKLDDTRVILDFYNVSNGLASEITSTNSSIVTSIRTAEHEFDGTTVTRVVLDLDSYVEYSITQSSDQKSVMVSFEMITLEDIDATNKNNRDYITIEGDGSFGAEVTTQVNPYRVVVEIPNVKSELPSSLSAKSLDYITEIDIEEDDSTVTITLYVDGIVECDWESYSGELIVTIMESSLDNMEYDSKDDALYLYDIDIDIDDIEMDDQYLLGYFDVILPENYEDELGYGTLQVGDTWVDSIKVDSTSKNTTIRFYQNQYMAYEVEEIDDGCVIYIKNPKDVYDNVVLIDAGHGGTDPGTSGNGLTEKDLTLTLALLTVDYLEDTGIKAYLTRDTDVYVQNALRAQTANEIADFMLSIHLNAAEDNGTANGTETLYKPQTETTSSKVLTSGTAADIMQGHLISALGLTNRGLKERTDLLILNVTTVPTILVEICFLTNVGDALKISTTSNQKATAKALAEGVEDIMERYDFR